MMIIVFLVWLPQFTLFIIIWHIFDYFFVNTQFWNAKFQDVNDKNMSQNLKKLR